MFKIFKLSLWAATLVSLPVYGVEQSFLIESPRSLGRGGARIATYDSDESTHINPATLGETNLSFQLRWFELDLIVGENTLDTVSDILDTISNPQGIQSLKKFSEKFGQKQYGRGQLSLLSMRFGTFEINPFVSNSTFLLMNSPILPEIEWQNDTVAGINLSYGFKISPTLSLGLTLRPFFRMYIAGAMATDQFMDLASRKTSFEKISPLKNGMGISGDLGAIWQPIANHRLGLTFHNIGDSGYLSKGDKIPPNLRQKISLGYLWRMQFLGMNLDYLADFQDLENRDGLNLVRLFHTGIECGFPFFTRDNDYGFTVGLNEGYITSGVYLDLYLIRIDIAHYTQETGIGVGQNKDKRWAITGRSSMTF